MSYSERSVIKLLIDAREASRLKRAVFTQIRPTGLYPTCEAEVDRFIKNRIKLYIDTWVAGPIEEALSLLKT